MRVKGERRERKGKKRKEEEDNRRNEDEKSKREKNLELVFKLSLPFYELLQ